MNTYIINNIIDYIRKYSWADIKRRNDNKNK